MSTIKIPTPLRAYTGGNAEISIQGETVGAALNDLTRQYPDLKQHIYEGEQLRNFVNVFIGDEDIRYRDGLDTDLAPSDNLRIIPSIAGGAPAQVVTAKAARTADAIDRQVDHSALRVNQAFIITLLIVAFVTGLWPLVAYVCAVMLAGSFVPEAAHFKLIYFRFLRPRGFVKPDVKRDNPEPHRFAQLVGGIFLLVATIAFLLRVPVLGWGLAWFVVALAALNLLAGICVGCIMYYQLHRLGVSGFTQAPIR